MAFNDKFGQDVYINPGNTFSDTLKESNVLTSMASVSSKRPRKRIFFQDFIYNLPTCPKTPRRKRSKVPSAYQQVFYTDGQAKKSVCSIEDKTVGDSTGKKPCVEQETVVSPRSRQCNDFMKIGLKLRNFVTLPRSFRWMCSEFFTSSIDSPLFARENDFVVFLQECMSHLRTRLLTRIEWTIIRRLMGKPRRFSAAFLKQERSDIERKRSAIRQIQYRRILPLSDPSYLPNEIPMRAVIGTKVNARLRKPLDGIFVGTVEAIDVANHSYRITFDKEGLGTHFVPDFETLSAMPVETLSAKSVRKIAQQCYKPWLPISALQPGQLNEYTVSTMTDNFSMNYLIHFVKLKKALDAKRRAISQLCKINSDAEKIIFHGKTIEHEFQRQYAHLIIYIETLNVDIQGYLTYFDKIRLDDCSAKFLETPGSMNSNHLNVSRQVSKITEKYFERIQRNRASILITNLVTVLVRLRNLPETNYKIYEAAKLNELLSNIQSRLSPKNIFHFQSNVEVHVQHCLRN